MRCPDVLIISYHPQLPNSVALELHPNKRQIFFAWQTQPFSLEFALCFVHLSRLAWNACPVLCQGTSCATQCCSCTLDPGKCRPYCLLRVANGKRLLVMTMTFTCIIYITNSHCNGPTVMVYFWEQQTPNPLEISASICRAADAPREHQPATKGARGES